jgi:hypothetical protein
VLTQSRSAPAVCTELRREPRAGPVQLSWRPGLAGPE